MMLNNFSAGIDEDRGWRCAAAIRCSLWPGARKAPGSRKLNGVESAPLAYERRPPHVDSVGSPLFVTFRLRARKLPKPVVRMGEGRQPQRDNPTKPSGIV